MENTEDNRKRLAVAVWETMSYDDIYRNFIHTTCALYASDPDSFDEDVAWMDLDNAGGE